jgi:hypothetical protein
MGTKDAAFIIISQRMNGNAAELRKFGDFQQGAPSFVCIITLEFTQKSIGFDQVLKITPTRNAFSVWE